MFEQERVIVRLQQRVMGEADIVACFLAGSYGRRTDDPYSDLDIALVFADATRREEVWQKRQEFVQSVMPYVPARSFDAEHIRPFFHIVLYSNGSKADYRFETQQELRPNPWDRDIRILKDTADKWGETFQAQSAQLYFPRPHLSAEALTQLDNRFWVMFWDVYRLLLRGDYDKPFTIYLQLLHFTLPALFGILPPEEPARKGLLQATYSPDTKVTLAHLRGLLEGYLAARTAVVKRLNLLFVPNSGFETAVLRLIKSKQ